MASPLLPTFGELLKRHRVATELTQEALAERAGLSARGISDLERGVRSAPRIDTVHHLANALRLGELERTAFVAAARGASSLGPSGDVAAGFDPLPLQPTALIGRDDDIASVLQQLLRDDVRLLTLTGPAGAGKTRLALEIASRLQQQFAHGVAFVDLTPLSNADLVMEKIALALGLTKGPGRPLVEQVCGFLLRKHMLLLIDNFEHVVSAAPVLVALLESCMDVKMLVTSRVVLHLRWEYEYVVPPLGLPDLSRPLDRAGVIATPAPVLFVERAQAIDRRFALTETNARAVAEICIHLDGLPLAIELAAACMKTLVPHTLLQRLRQRFDLLVTGGTDLAPRQRTLRAAVDWSYDLLLPEEQTLFRRLSVFAGGWTLESAEAVCPGESITREDVPTLLARLIDASLVVVEPRPGTASGELRFHLLETLRQYAGEKLRQAGAAAILHARHRNWFLAFAEQAESQLHGPAQVLWMDRLQEEEDNLRAALDWCVAAFEPEQGLRLATSLAWFWFVRARQGEGRARLARLLALAGEVPPAAVIRAKGLSAAGFLAHDQRDYDAARTLQEESLAIARREGDTQTEAVAVGRLGYLALHQREFVDANALLSKSVELFGAHHDAWGSAYALNILGLVALRLHAYEMAEHLFGESQANFRTLGDSWGIAWTLRGLAQIALDRGNWELATNLWQERLTLSRELGDAHATAYSLDYLATAARMQKDFDRAALLFSQSLALWNEWGDKQFIAWTLHNMGDLALDRGDIALAAALYQDSLAFRVEVGDQSAIATSLEGFAALAAAYGQSRQALVLAGAAVHLHDATNVPPTPTERMTVEGRLASARRKLSRLEATEAMAEGASLTLERAVVYAKTIAQTPSAHAAVIARSTEGPTEIPGGSL